MNNDIIQGKWLQLKGSVKAEWGKLTDDEIDRINGNAEVLAGRVQEAYGLSRDQAKERVRVWMDKQDL